MKLINHLRNRLNLISEKLLLSSMTKEELYEEYQGHYKYMENEDNHTPEKVDCFSKRTGMLIEEMARRNILLPDVNKNE